MEFEKGISFEGDKENDILQAEGERKSAVQDWRKDENSKTTCLQNL